MDTRIIGNYLESAGTVHVLETHSDLLADTASCAYVPSADIRIILS